MAEKKLKPNLASRMHHLFKGHPEEVKNFWFHFVQQKRKPYSFNYTESAWKTLFEQYLNETGREYQTDLSGDESASDFYEQIKPYLNGYLKDNYFIYPPVPSNETDVKNMFDPEVSKHVVYKYLPSKQDEKNVPFRGLYIRLISEKDLKDVYKVSQNVVESLVHAFLNNHSTYFKSFDPQNTVALARHFNLSYCTCLAILWRIFCSVNNIATQFFIAFLKSIKKRGGQAKRQKVEEKKWDTKEVAQAYKNFIDEWKKKDINEYDLDILFSSYLTQNIKARILDFVFHRCLFWILQISKKGGLETFYDLHEETFADDVWSDLVSRDKMSGLVGLQTACILLDSNYQILGYVYFYSSLWKSDFQIIGIRLITDILISRITHPPSIKPKISYSLHILELVALQCFFLGTNTFEISSPLESMMHILKKFSHMLDLKPETEIKLNLIMQGAKLPAFNWKELFLPFRFQGIDEDEDENFPTIEAIPFLRFMDQLEEGKKYLVLLPLQPCLY